MSTIKQTVQQCGKLVEDSELKDALQPLWKQVAWQINPDNASATVTLAHSDALINLYPGLERNPNAAALVLREFGAYILRCGGARAAAIWKHKLAVPTPEQVAQVVDKLADTALRQKCKTYKDVLDQYPDKGGSVDRLVYINMMNALLANNISYPDSVGVDIMTWGPTTDYANLKKYHTLVPLVSAYAPADVYSDFGHALAAQLLNNFGQVRDKSVAFALRGIVQRIAKLAASPAS